MRPCAEGERQQCGVEVPETLPANVPALPPEQCGRVFETKNMPAQKGDEATIDNRSVFALMRANRPRRFSTSAQPSNLLRFARNPCLSDKGCGWPRLLLPFNQVLVLHLRLRSYPLRPRSQAVHLRQGSNYCNSPRAEPCLAVLWLVCAAPLADSGRSSFCNNKTQYSQ